MGIAYSSQRRRSTGLWRKSLKATDAITISAIQTFITAVISIAGALLFDDISTITKIQPEAWAVVIYLAITCTCLAYFLQTLP